QAIATAKPQPATGAISTASTVTVTLNPPPQPGIPEGPAGYTPTYFGNTIDRANASVIHVGAGEERTGLDIRVQTVRSTIVQGQVAMPPWPNAAVQVYLTSDDPSASGFNNSTRANPNGRFAFRDIAPGRYTLIAQTVAQPVMSVSNGVYTTMVNG